MQGSRQIRRVAALALAAGVIGASPASAHHQPGDSLADVFRATIDVQGQYNASVTDSTGGSWIIQASPFWKLVFPEVPVPIHDDATFSPQADYNRSDATAGPATWQGTSNYDFQGGPDPFSCTGPLQGPNMVGRSFRYRDSVIGQGENVKFELTTLNAITLAGNGGCSPQTASITTGWGTDILNETQVFTTIPREELFLDDRVFRPISRSSPNSSGFCTVAIGGGCSPSLTWDGTLTLEKVCRNYAGTATTVSNSSFSATNSFCESPCDGPSCQQEDFEVPPLAHPAKEKKGSVEFAASCYGNSPCDGKLTLSTGSAGAAKTVKLGSSSLAVEPADHTEVKVKLSGKGKRLLADEGSLKATLKSALTGDVAEATDSVQVKIKD